MMVKSFDWSVKRNDCFDWSMMIKKFVGHCLDRVNFPTVEIVTRIYSRLDNLKIIWP